jgi:hypothetical protein
MFHNLQKKKGKKLPFNVLSQEIEHGLHAVGNSVNSCGHRVFIRLIKIRRFNFYLITILKILSLN